MKLQDNRAVSVRLVIGFSAIILVLVAVLTMAYLTLLESENSQRRMLEENFGNLYDLPALRANINGQRLAVAMLLNADASEEKDLIDEVHIWRATADSIIENLIIRFRDDPEESDLLGRLIAVREAYQSVVDTQTVLIERGERTRAKALFIGIQMENHRKMRALLRALEGVELKEARGMVKEAEDSARLRKEVFLGLGVLGLFLAGGLGVYLSKTISSYLEELKMRQEALSRANRSLRILNACDSVILRATDETSLLHDICKSIVQTGGYKMVWVGYALEDKNKSVRPMAFAGDDGEYVRHADITWSDETDRGRGPTGTCIRTGETVVVRDTTTQAGFEPWRYRAHEMGYRGSATFPLREGSRVYGALMIYSAKQNDFSDDEVQLLTQLADDISHETLFLREQSARAEAEKRARDSTLLAVNLLEASMDPMMLVDRDGRISDINTSVELATGRTRVELLGAEFAVCFANPDEARTALKDAIANGFLKGFLLQIRHNGGSSRNARCNAIIYRNEEGELQVVFAAAFV